MIDLMDTMIEVTRRCNLRCEHCLRGDTQPVDLDPQMFKLFLDKLALNVERIYTVTITGGEPFLVPEIILECIEIIREHEIEVGRLWVSTNGLITDNDVQDAVLAILRYNIETGENGYPGVKISSDQFHEPLNNEEKAWWSVFSGVEVEDDRVVDTKYIIPEGRGKDVSEMDRPLFGLPTRLDLEDDESFEGDVYLNVKGNVSIGCNFSYETQDIIPHLPVSEFTLEKLVEIFNKRAKTPVPA